MTTHRSSRRRVRRAFTILEPGDPEHSWLGLMRFDYVTMVEALGGDASVLTTVDVADVGPDTAEYPQ